MSQILIDTLNSVQDEAVKAMQSKVAAVAKPATTGATTTTTSAMDKSSDFKNTLEKTLTKLESKLNNNEAPKTLGDLKSQLKDADILTSLPTFREILNKASSEANIETSLDLTLDKDISEIIAQFKEAIENAKNKNFEIAEDTEELEETPGEELNSDFDMSVVLDEILNSQNGEITKDVKDLKELDLSALDLTAILGQILSKIDTKNIDMSADEFKATLSKELTSMLDELNIDETSKNSLVEFVETMDIEVAEEVVKPLENNIAQDFEIPLDEDILKELHIESIQAEAGNAEGEAFMQQQTAQEHVVKAMINQEVETFDIKIEKTMDAQPVQTAPTKVADANPSKILNQIVKQMEGMQNGSKVNIVLNPESLGKVNVQLLSTKEGLMAQLTVSTPEARDALMKGLDGLKESLLSHGVNVDNVSVKMNETQKSSYNPDWTEQEGSRGGNKEQGRSNKDEKEKGLFEQMMAQANEENGNV